MWWQPFFATACNWLVFHSWCAVTETFLPGPLFPFPLCSCLGMLWFFIPFYPYPFSSVVNFSIHRGANSETILQNILFCLEVLCKLRIRTNKEIFMLVSGIYLKACIHRWFNCQRVLYLLLWSFSCAGCVALYIAASVKFLVKTLPSSASLSHNYFFGHFIIEIVYCWKILELWIIFPFHLNVYG